MKEARYHYANRPHKSRREFACSLFATRQQYTTGARPQIVAGFVTVFCGEARKCGARSRLALRYEAPRAAA